MHSLFLAIPTQKCIYLWMVCLERTFKEFLYVSSSAHFYVTSHSVLTLHGSTQRRTSPNAYTEAFNMHVMHTFWPILSFLQKKQMVKVFYLAPNFTCNLPPSLLSNLLNPHHKYDQTFPMVYALLPAQQACLWYSERGSPPHPRLESEIIFFRR